MSKVEWKGGTLLAPLPVVMVSCGNAEKSNIITVAWTGIINSDPPKTYVSIRPERFSYDMIDTTKEFVINLVRADMVYETDYCGIKSGSKVDKWQELNLTKEYGNKVACPMIKQSPMSLECRVTDKIKLGSHDMFIADILAVNVSENLIDANQKLHLDNANLAAYIHGEYFAIGKKLASFGFSTKKPQKLLNKTSKANKVHGTPSQNKTKVQNNRK